MDIKVTLPKPNDTTGKDIKKFLRQLELCVHHLTKSVDQMEADGDLGESTFIMYRFPFLEKQYGVGINSKNEAVVHVDESAEGMQEIEIEIIR